MDERVDGRAGRVHSDVDAFLWAGEGIGEAGGAGGTNRPRRTEQPSNRHHHMRSGAEAYFQMHMRYVQLKDQNPMSYLSR